METSLVREAFGWTLRDLRHDQGRSLRDVARDAGTSVGLLLGVERGQVDATSDVLASLCGALDVAPAELLTLAASRMQELAGAELDLVA